MNIIFEKLLAFDGDKEIDGDEDGYDSQLPHVRGHCILAGGNSSSLSFEAQ